MGLGDRLNKVLDGIEDIVSAPVGFVWDMTQVPVRDDLSFGDPFATGLTDLVTGLAKVSEGTGISGLGRGVASNTPFDEALSGIIREGELLYNQDFQRELGQTPFGISDLPFTDYDLQPGDLSVAKVASVGLQVAGQGPEGDFDFQEMWRRADFTSPGQSFIASAFGAWDLGEQEREEFFASFAFQASSGTIDAITRWYAQPEIMAGKSIKVARARWNPDVNRRISLFQKKFGMDAASSGTEGAADLVVTGSRGKSLYTVVRSSEVRDSFRDRAIVMMASEEDAGRYASELWRINPDDTPLIIKIDPEGMPIMLDDITRPFVKGSDGFADDAALLGFTDNLDKHATGVMFPPEADLDPSHFRWAMDPGSMPDHLRPAGSLDQTLYTPQGMAIEPRDLYRATEVENTILGARSIYNDLGETEAIKFIRSRQIQGGKQGPTLQDYIFGEKRVQGALNDMEGKSASYIRRVYFREVPGGGTLATFLTQATSYRQRVAIIAASMGIQVPEAATLSPITRAR